MDRWCDGIGHWAEGEEGVLRAGETDSGTGGPAVCSCGTEDLL